MLGLDLQKAGNTITISQTQKDTNTTRFQNTTDEWYITASEEVPQDQQYFMTQNKYYVPNGAAVPGVLVPIGESEITSQFQNTMGQHMFYNTMGPSGIGGYLPQDIAPNQHRPPSQYIVRPQHDFQVENRNNNNNMNSNRAGTNAIGSF